jgi:Tfp pilus assembly protein PilF
MDANEIYNEGVKLFKDKKHQEAYDLFTKAINKKATVFNYFHARGLCAKNMNKDDEAIKDFEKVLELRPGYLKSLSIVVKLYTKKGDTEKALNAFSTLIKTSPSAFHYFDRGTLLSETGKDDEAILDFTKAIELDETMSIAYYNRGLLYYQLKDYEKAIKDFDKTLQYSDSEPEANTYIDRGLCYYYTDRDTEALKDFKKALEIEPENKRAKNLLEQLQ